MADEGWTIEEEAVHVVKLILVCHCGAEMRHSGVMLTSNPAQYPHYCANNHATQPPHPHRQYPGIAFKDVMTGEIIA